MLYEVITATSTGAGPTWTPSTQVTSDSEDRSDEAHRARQRDGGRGCQPSAQAVRRDAADAEDGGPDDGRRDDEPAVAGRGLVLHPCPDSSRASFSGFV